MGKRLKGKDLIKLGFPQDNSIQIALGQLSRYKQKESKEKLLSELKNVLTHTEKYKGDPIWGKIAEAISSPVEVKKHELLKQRVAHTIFGENEIDDVAKYQIYNALKLPVAIAGALMPDAHAGYGLPIGGVLATKNQVIPYGVGVDIGCRMALSIYPESSAYLKGKVHQFKNMLSNHTKFGMKETHDKKHDHELFEDKLFTEIPLLKKLKTKAYQQLGTSGGGNHFVEFGEVILEANNRFNLPAGNYLGLLTHSGSRSLGANIAKHYTYLARKQCPLPKQAQHLAWLDLDKHDGQEYWMAMNLAGEYAKACHDNIHKRLSKLIGMQSIVHIDNHHNFAWKEMYEGKECIVHRKGATPANEGELGIIPGSMTAPGYIVEGKGNSLSLNSASHGAGRVFSRSKCKETFTPSSMIKQLQNAGVELIGGGIDEAPMAYKDINKVMGNQTELVKVLGTFIPKIVRMGR